MERIKGKKEEANTGRRVDEMKKIKGKGRSKYREKDI